MVVALLLVAGSAGCAPDTTGEAKPPSPTASEPATIGPTSAEPASIEPGTYRLPTSAWSVADLAVTLPPGWTVQYGHVFAKHPDEDDELGFYPVTVDEIYTDACRGEGVPMKVGPLVDDLVDSLLEQRGPATSRPVDTTVGGHPATRIDLKVPQRLDMEKCRLDGLGLQIWYSMPADKYFVLLPHAMASVYILNVDGQRQVFVVQHGSATSDANRLELQSVLDSIRIG